MDFVKRRAAVVLASILQDGVQGCSSEPGAPSLTCCIWRLISNKDRACAQAEALRWKATVGSLSSLRLLIRFSLSRRDYVTSLDSTGTFAWAAPELLLGRRCTERVDIYSFGALPLSCTHYDDYNNYFVN